jgi:hypothetical protein
VKQAQVEVFLADSNGLDRHLEDALPVEGSDDFVHGLAAPGIEELFAELAVPFAQRLFPGDVMQRHGVGDGAIAVEEIGLK